MTIRESKEIKLDRCLEPWAKVPKHLIESPILTDGEYRTLTCLLSFKNIYISQSELGKRLGKDRSTMLRHIKSLVEKGFIIKKYRRGRTCIIKLTSKCRLAAEFPQGYGVDATQVDKPSNSIYDGNKQNDELLEIFMLVINSYPQPGQKDMWLESINQLVAVGVAKWQIMEMSYFIKENEYWYKRILSPLDLLKIDKSGVAEYKRIIKQAGIER